MTIKLETAAGLHRIEASIETRKLETRAQTLGLELVGDGVLRIPDDAPLHYQRIVESATAGNTGDAELTRLEGANLTFQNQALTMSARGLSTAVRAEIARLQALGPSETLDVSRLNRRLEHFAERLNTLYPSRTLGSQKEEASVEPLREELKSLAFASVEFVEAVAERLGQLPSDLDDSYRSFEHQLKTAREVGSIASVAAGILADQPRTLSGPDWTQAVVGPYAGMDDHLVALQGGTAAERANLAAELPKAFGVTSRGRELVNPDYLAFLEASAEEAGITITYPTGYPNVLQAEMLRRADERVAEAMTASAQGDTPYATAGFALQRMEQLCEAAGVAPLDRYSEAELVGTMTTALRRQVERCCDGAISELGDSDDGFYQLGNAAGWVVRLAGVDGEMASRKMAELLQAVESELQGTDRFQLAVGVITKALSRSTA